MFDEPLGALDRSLKDHLLDELRGLLHTSEIPAIYVTHDQEEAFAIADRILLLHEGVIEQAGTPAQVATHPLSRWVSEFLGLGNVIEGKWLGDGRAETSFGVLEVECGPEAGKGESVALLIRPEHVKMIEGGDGLKGQVADVLFQKNSFRVTLESGLYFYTSTPPEVGTKLTFSVDVECLR
jgi:ABC-type Fe3+/spermidine/putrescine transport system ATPase subunit